MMDTTKSSTKQSSQSKLNLLIVLGIFLLALGLRLGNYWQISHNDPYFEHPIVDSKVYHDWAMQISTGDWIGHEVFFNCPLYPYAIAILYKIKPSIAFVKLVQAVLGAITCVLIYLLTRMLFNNKISIIAALMATFYSMFIFYEGILVITNIQTPLHVLMLISLYKSIEKHKLKYWFISGVLLGLSILARTNVILFIPVVILGIFLHAKSYDWWKKLTMGIVFLAGIFLVVFPVTLRNYYVSKEITLVTSHVGINFYIGNNPESIGVFQVPSIIPRSKGADPIQQKINYKLYAEKTLHKSLTYSEVSSYFMNLSLTFIKENTWQWVKLLIRKLALFVNHYEVGNNRSIYFSKQFSKVLQLPLINFLMLCPFALLGFFLLLKEWKKMIFMYGIIMVYLATVVLFFMLSRYRMPIIPFLIIFAAYAIHWLVLKIKEKQFKQIIPAGLAVCFFFFIVNLDLVQSERNVEYANYAYAQLMAGNMTLAIENYKKSIQLKPDDISSHCNLAALYEKNKEYDKALQQWEQVESIAGEQNDDEHVKQAKERINLMRHFQYYKKAMVDKASGSIESAVDNLKKAISYQPNNISAYQELASLYEKKPKWSKLAIQSWKKLLEMTKTIEKDEQSAAAVLSLQKKALIKLAFMYANQKEYSESIFYFKELIALQPQNNAYYYNIACLYAKQNNKGDAIRWLEDAISKGFRDCEKIKNDIDLDNIKNLKMFNDTIKRCDQ